MKITTRTIYGLRAIIELALNYNKKPVKRKEISEKQDIREAYLENILLILKSAGLVSSFRGPEGGYILNRPPSLIKLGEIVEALDGQFDPTGHVNKPQKCDKNNDCLTKDIWIKLREIHEKFLHSITLEDILTQRN
ncbi:hypothetical protein AMJ80_03055 [bacterium SM23_31]|nr:MAG: hypothetical protein AMJ80_03055 [bacterium SM23_31]